MGPNRRGGRVWGRAAIVCSLAVLFVSFPVRPARAQRVREAAAAALSEMEAAAGARVESKRSALTGTARFVRARTGIAVEDRGTALGRAHAFVDAHGAAFGLRDATQVRTLRAPVRDRLGIDHVRLQQVVNEVPVVGGELLVHLRGSRVLSAHGKTLPDLDGFDTRPLIPAVTATELARRFCETELQAPEAQLSEPRLEVLNKGIFDGRRHPTRLVWFVEARGPALREYLWIDAQHGSLALHFSQLGEARNRNVYTTDEGFLPLLGNQLGSEAFPPAGDADAVAAYNFSGDFYDYLWAEQGLDSYDGTGVNLSSVVHHCDAVSCPYQGAFWNGEEVLFGDGWPLADDIVAHEWTHALIGSTARLYNYKQSGALAESLADIFGETIDQWNTDRGDQARRGNDTAAVRWRIGEDLPGGAIRNMMNPNQFGDPGKTSDPQFRCGSDDDGRLHTNAGVPNHAYALMVDGGTYNGVTVTGIGLRKAARIQYWTLTHYLTTPSDFMDYYDGVQQACAVLVNGPEGITEADCQQVQRALDAVQIAAPALCSQAVEPEVCPAGKVPSDLFFDGFESGSANWTPTQPLGTAEWVVAGNYPRTGTQGLLAEAWIPQLSDAREEMKTPVTIPAGDVRLRFDHAYDLDRRFAAGVVEYSVDGGANWLDAWPLYFEQRWYGGVVPNEPTTGPLSGRSVFTDASSGYVVSQLDLHSLAGQDVRFRFRLGLQPRPDVSLGTGFGWAIDNVRLYQCVDQPSPTLSVDDVTVREGPATAAVFTVSLSAPLSSDVTVQYATSDITAFAASDYYAASDTLTIPAGHTSKTVVIWMKDDVDPEPVKQFQITLGNATHATIAKATGSGTILDDDDIQSPPTTHTWAVARRGMSTQKAIAYGAGLYVSVGGHEIWTSPDGISWSLRGQELGKGAVAITYGGGRFVATGYEFVATSSDGLVWTDVSSALPAGFSPTAITFGGGTYVAVGWDGVIYTSTAPDAGTWQAADSGTATAFLDVAYGDGRFVAVGGQTVLTSTDAVQWSAQAVADYFRGVTHTPTQFVAVGFNAAWTWSGGTEWTSHALDLTYYEDVTAGPGGALVAVGQRGVATSADGDTWQELTLPNPGPGGSRKLYAVTHGPGGYVAVGEKGAVFTSADGVTWTSRLLPASRNLRGVAFDGIRFCAVGQAGAAASSPDGITWTNVATPPPAPGTDYGDLNAVNWAANLFVAVGGHTILTSPDCRTWTARSPSWSRTTGALDASLRDVTYAAGRYVAVGTRFANSIWVPTILTSTDAVHWSEVELPAVSVSRLLSVAYGAGRFLAVGQRWTGGRRFVLASEDGTAWTQIPAEIGETIGNYDLPARLRYPNGMFVLVSDGPGWTSADGTAWTAADGAWGIGDLAYGSSRFVGVSDIVKESLDGKHWESLASPVTNSLYGVAYGAALDRFVAVGESVIVYTTDSLPALSVDDVSAAEDAGPMQVSVRLSQASGKPVTVQYATKDGTAKAPADYAAASGMLTFQPGETVKLVDVPLVADGVAEPAETFTVTLSNPGGATIADATGVATITDGATSLSFSVADVTMPQEHSGGWRNGFGGMPPHPIFNSLTFTVTLSSPSPTTTTVAYATADGTATVAGGDYLPTNGTLTFDPGFVSRTVVVRVNGDRVHEADETFKLVLSSPSNARIDKGTGIATIVDDDAPGGVIEFASPTYTVKESAGVATISVKRNGSLADPQTIDWATMDSSQTAIPDVDYKASTGTLTFEKGVKTRSFTVRITADRAAEGDETVNLTLSNPGGGAVLGLQSTAVLTIADDDVGGTIRFSATTYTASESATAATITVVRSGGVADGASVDYVTSDGTAKAGSHYQTKSGTLRFPAGVLSQPIKVPMVKNGVAEGPKDFTVTLSNPQGGAILGSPASAVVTIADDEPMLQFSAAGYSVSEAGGSATITVVRSGSLAPCSVKFATSDGSAKAADDYTPPDPNPGTLTFDQGVLSQTFKVKITQDALAPLAEGDETVFLTLSNPVGAYLGKRDHAVLTIKDDEPVVQFASTRYTVSEKAGSAVLTVVSTGGPAAFAVNYGTTPDTAVPGGDYQLSLAPLQFAAHQTTATITAQILQDTEGEPDEGFWVTLYTAGPGVKIGPRKTAYVTIKDDEPVVQFSASTYTVSEATGTIRLPVVRSSSLAHSSVAYETIPASAQTTVDFQDTHGTLDFKPGVTTQAIEVHPTLDGTLETDESFQVALSSPSGASLGPRSTATVTIKEASPVVRFSSATYTVTEPTSGTTNATITVTRTGTAQISVHYATSDGTATSQHYDTASGTLTFPNGPSQAFTVTIHHTDGADPFETVNLTLFDATGAAIGSPATAVLTISDATPALQFSKASYSVPEAGAATITVVRSGTASTDCTVHYATSDGTATATSDYTGSLPGATLSFGKDVSSQTFNVSISPDTLGETAETVNLTLSDPTGGCVLGPLRTAVLTINDNEPVVQFSSTAYTASEAAAAAAITLVRSGSTAPFTVQYSTGDGTATAGIDYAARTGTVSFAAGVMSRTFTVPITNDTLHQLSHTVQLALVAASGARIGPRDTAVLTITDNDAGGTLGFSAPVYTISEIGGSATVTVSRTGGTASAVMVDYATVDGTATAGVNYTTANGTLVFDAGVTTQAFQVPIIYGAPDGEPSRTALLTLQNPRGGATLGAQKAATLVILDVP